MKPPDSILIGPDSILLIFPPLEMKTGILMQSVGRCGRECYPFDGQLVQDKLKGGKSGQGHGERKWL